MNSFDPQSQGRFLQNNNTTHQPRKPTTKPVSKNHDNNNSISRVTSTSFQRFGLNNEEAKLVSSVIPPVTVVLEGRSICQRISLEKHESYQSFALALRQMFVDGSHSTDDVNLSNAIPGYRIAYEDIENDLLLAGDLTWNDFVRVAKRIRILPVKENTRKMKRND